MATIRSHARFASQSPSENQHQPPTSANRRRGRRVYTKDDIAELLTNCGQLSGDIDGVPRSLWWRAFILIGWLTGLKTAALLRIEFRDIDHKRRLLHVRGEHRPPIKLSADAIAAVVTIAMPKRDAIFPWPADCGDFRAECSRVLDQVAGVVGDEDESSIA